VLANISTQSPVSQLNDAVQAISLIGAGERGLIPDVVTLLKLCLVLPASTASSERSFSTLRRIKSYLRATMLQERLNHLLILNTYKERIDDIDAMKLLRCFVQRNEMRQRVFAVPP
jgi:histone deacetylase complex regulatory component SIN3